MADDPELQDAIYELHRYFSDQVAPLMVADSLEVLLRYPASVVGAQIQAWSGAQRASAPSVPMSDFLFHAAKKVFLVGEFELVSKPVLSKYLQELGGNILQYCPAEERPILQQNLEALGRSLPAMAPVVDVRHMQGRAAAPVPAQPAAPAGGTISRAVAQGLKRLSLFLERLQPLAGASAPAEERTEVASQFVAQAAAQAQSAKELDEQLKPLAQLGIDTTTSDKVIKVLAETLPGWGPLPAAGPGGAPAPVGTELGAMKQIVSLPEDPAEVAKRFRELVHSAIEQFNHGNLGRSVTMFELAEQLAAGKVKASFVEAVRKNGHEHLDNARLAKVAQRVDSRPALRTVLNFFDSLRPDGLLHQLDGEPRRERRHELLDLLECHGAPARKESREILEGSVDNPTSGVAPFFQMNLVYLLRVIPRPDDVPPEDEISLVMRAPGRDSPPPLVKQVIAYLAANRHEKSERALITYLKVFENMLLQPETAVYPAADIDTLLERTCAALARYGTPRSWKALVDHGLKTEARLGGTLARLVEAGRQDLSSSRELVDRLVAALRGELPRKVLGVTVKKNDDRITWLIQALSGTSTLEVCAVLQEIVDKHPGEKFTATAAKALALLQAPPKSPETSASLTGDLELFGLPGLLQTLGQGQLTGIVTLINAQGHAQSTVLLDKGQFRGAEFGSIRGEEAMFQLFERPFPGTFAFVSRAEVASQPAAEPAQDVIALILEGVRRHDEFKRAATLAPDKVKLKATGTPQTPLGDEDEDFTYLVWKKAAAGTTPAECESSIPTDAYRIRRLLAHWLEEGALAAG